MLRSGKAIVTTSWWAALALLALVGTVWASDSDADDPTGSHNTLHHRTRVLVLQGRSTEVAFNPGSSCHAPLFGVSQCLVTWRKGATVAVNWLGPPPGNVSIELVPVKGGTTYTIVASYPSISQEGYCDGGYGLGVVTHGVECGRVEFKVPSGWSEVGNYSIAVTSLRDDSLVGYTDLIRIAPANSSTADDAPDGTSVSLLNIPSPTSTNLAGATVFDGKIPSPTAIVTFSVTTIVTSSFTTTSSTKAISSSRASTVSVAPSHPSLASLPASSARATWVTRPSSSTPTSAVQSSSCSSLSATVPIVLGIYAVFCSIISLFCT
ncbi:BZ3501_MvSof-1269-A2-R1_Chr12-1g03354 [Microbotryum saponariae]|nr:BZ3501_MvSof-1269-A2-R1_Chr12-1g03354 [Microbotryum saponariae]